MLRSRSTRTLLPSLLAGLVFACSGNEAANDEAASDPAVEETQNDTDTAQAEAAAPAEPGNATSAPIAVDDIDRWSKGLEGELIESPRPVSRPASSLLREKRREGRSTGPKLRVSR